MCASLFLLSGPFCPSHVYWDLTVGVWYQDLQQQQLWLLYNIWILIHFHLFWFRAEQKEKCLLKIGFKKNPLYRIRAGCFVSWQRTVGYFHTFKKTKGIDCSKKKLLSKARKAIPIRRFIILILMMMEPRQGRAWEAKKRNREDKSSPSTRECKVM